MLLNAALVAVACSGESEETPGTAEEEETAEVDVTLRCQELGYPCNWGEAGERVFERSVELLDRTAEALRGGGDPERVAAELADQDDVVAVNHDVTGVMFRVAGAPPVVAHAPEASPAFNGLVALADQRELPMLSAGTGRAILEPGRRVLAAVSRAARAVGVRRGSALLVGLTERGRLPTLAAEAAYEPVQPAGIRPRSALVVRPWETYDARTLMTELRRRRGDVELTGELDWDAYKERLARTEAVIRDNDEHYTIERDDSVLAFQSFAAHDLVLLATHSSNFECEEGREVCGEVLGGPRIESTHVEIEELSYQDVAELPDGATIGEIFDQWRVAFTADFFTSTYGRDEAEGTILIVNSCKTGEAEVAAPTSALMAAFGRSGAVFAWDEFIDGIAADELTARLVRNLVDWGIRTGDAYDELGSDEITHTIRGGTSATLVWAGRDIRARDVITVEIDGRAMQPGEHIPVRGEPEDGEDDVISEIAFRVDGVTKGEEGAAVLRWQLPLRHDDLLEIEKPLTDAREVPGRDHGEWHDLLLEVEDLDLEFDLDREDLICCREHRMIAEVKTEGTRPSQHDIEPVFLRQETVEVLHPELGRPLASGETVELERGEANDGTPEEYPLIAKLDFLDPERLDEYRLRVSVHDEELERGIDELTRKGEGTYELEETVELYDFPDDEEQIVVDAELTRDGRQLSEVVVDPLNLLLSASCEWHLRIDGEGTWAGNFASYGRPHRNPGWTFMMGFQHHDQDAEPSGGLTGWGAPPPEPGQLGTFTFDGYLRFQMGYRGWLDADGVELTVTASTEDRMEGELTGVFEGSGGFSRRIVKRTYTLTFEAGNGELDSPCGPDPDEE